MIQFNGQTSKGTEIQMMFDPAQHKSMVQVSVPSQNISERGVLATVQEKQVVTLLDSRNHLLCTPEMLSFLTTERQAECKRYDLEVEAQKLVERATKFRASKPEIFAEAARTGEAQILINQYAGTQKVDEEESEVPARRVVMAQPDGGITDEIVLDY